MPQVAYFKSFAAYDVPLRPQGPVSFAATAGLSSYLVTQYGDDGRLAELTKVIVEREATGEQALLTQCAPGSVLFFRADASERGGPALGPRVDYAATIEQDALIRGRVAPSGFQVSWELLRRKPLFRENYAYWPGGALKERVVWRADGRVSRWAFDRAGRVESAGQDQDRNLHTPAPAI